MTLNLWSSGLHLWSSRTARPHWFHAVVGFKPRASCMPGKCSTKRHPQAQSHDLMGTISPIVLACFSQSTISTWINFWRTSPAPYSVSQLLLLPQGRDIHSHPTHSFTPQTLAEGPSQCKKGCYNTSVSRGKAGTLYLKVKLDILNS